MGRNRSGVAARTAAPPIPSPAADAPAWQVARLATPGEVFTTTSIRGVVTTVTADSLGVVFPRSIEELRLVEHLPVATPERIAAAPAAAPTDQAPAASPTEPTDDAGDDADEED